jgi:hypothetical protein
VAIAARRSSSLTRARRSRARSAGDRRLDGATQDRRRELIDRQVVVGAGGQPAIAVAARTVAAIDRDHRRVAAVLHQRGQHLARGDIGGVEQHRVGLRALEPRHQLGLERRHRDAIADRRGDVLDHAAGRRGDHHPHRLGGAVARALDRGEAAGGADGHRLHHAVVATDHRRIPKRFTTTTVSGRPLDAPSPRRYGRAACTI